jgi:hypothetical protein
VGWENFTVEIVKALAWPVTVLIIVCLLRRPLARAIRTLQKVKYKDLELEFQKKIEKATAEAEEAKLPAPPSELLQAFVKGTNLELATKSPIKGIVEAFAQVAGALRELAARKNLKLPPSLIGMATALLDAGVIDTETLDVFRQLIALRNEVSGAPAASVSAHSAIQYVTLAKRLEDHLRSL